MGCAREDGMIDLFHSLGIGSSINCPCIKVTLPRLIIGLSEEQMNSSYSQADEIQSKGKTEP